MKIHHKCLRSSSLSFIILISFFVILLLNVNSASAFFGGGGGGARRGKKDLYTVLGVSKKATDKEINKAFRKLSMEWHPDSSKHENAKEVYSEILKAKGILGDADKRKIYDQYGVIEGEDGVPSAEQRQRNGGGGRHPFEFNPFSDFFREQEEFHRQYYRQQQRQQSEPIKFNDKNTPELDLQRFSRMREFRGPKLFAVFAYVDFSQESRIFANVWDRVSASSTSSSSSAVSPSQFEGLISFTRLNLQKNEVVMNLAGIPPQSIPLIFVVRDGVAEVVDADCVAIIPNSITQMTDILTMCLMDYANDLMKAANDEIVSVVRKSSPNNSNNNGDDGVLRTTKEVFDFIFIHHRFQPVLLIDKNHPGVNAVPTAAAVRSQFADIVIAFVERHVNSNNDIDDIFSPNRVCTKRAFNQKKGGSPKIVIDRGDFAWLYKPNSYTKTSFVSSSELYHRICAPDKSFTLSGRSQLATLVSELSVELMGEPIGNQHADVRLFARPSAALLSPNPRNEHRDVAKLITGNTINQVFGAEVEAEVNRIAKKLSSSNQQQQQKKKKEFLPENDQDEKILTHVIVQFVSASNVNNNKKVILGYKNSERLSSNFENRKSKQSNNVHLLERIHARDIFTIDIDQNDKIPEKFRNQVLDQNNNIATLLIVSLTHDTDPSSSSSSSTDHQENRNPNMIISLIKSQVRLLSITPSSSSSSTENSEKFVEEEILKSLLQENNNNNNKNSLFAELVFDSENRDNNKNILFKPFEKEVRQKIREKHGDDKNNNNNDAEEEQEGHSSSSSSYQRKRNDDLYDSYDYSHIDYLQFIVRIDGYDQYPPEAWYQSIVRWTFWILRRLLSGFSFVSIFVLYFLKTYVLGPIWRRLFGRGNYNNNENTNNNNNADGGGRAVPNNVNLATSVYGLITFDRNEFMSARAQDLFLVAVSTSSSATNNNKIPFMKSQPTASSNPIFEGFEDLKSKQMSTQVKLRGCLYNNINNNQSSEMFKKIVDAIGSGNFYRTSTSDAEGAVFFVAMRRTSNGVIRAAVMTNERKNVKTFVERVLEGTESLKADVL